MGARWARVARGWSLAAFATFVAALSHTLAGGDPPGLLAIAVSLAFSGLLCTALAGRKDSLWRVVVSVVAAQAVLHALFSLGTPSSGSIASLRPTAAVSHHGAAGSSTSSLSSSADGLLAAHSAIHFSAWMILAHFVAAVITLVAIRHGDRAMHLIGRVISLQFRALTRVAETPVISPDGDRASRMPVPILTLPREIALVLSSLRHRGPPLSALAA